MLLRNRYSRSTINDACSLQQLEHLFMKIDANSSGTIGFDDFTNYLLLQQVDSPLKPNCLNSILNSAIMMYIVCWQGCWMLPRWPYKNVMA